MRLKDSRCYQNNGFFDVLYQKYSGRSLANKLRCIRVKAVELGDWTARNGVGVGKVCGLSVRSFRRPETRIARKARAANPVEMTTPAAFFGAGGKTQR